MGLLIGHEESEEVSLNQSGQSFLDCHCEIESEYPLLEEGDHRLDSLPQII
jgi:hypothetical protein